MRRPRIARISPRAARGEIDAVEADRAVEAGEIVRQQPQDRKPGDGLAAAAFADDADAFARRNVEIDLAGRLPDAVRGLEADAEAAHRHQRLRAAAPVRLRCAGPGRRHQPAARFLSFTSCSSISISVPMMPSRASCSSLGVRQPQHAAEYFAIMLAERRRRAADRKRLFAFRGTASTAADACR